MQKQADILIKLLDRDRINVLAVRIPCRLPTGVLPILDMQKYLSSKQGTELSIGLAVIIFPVEGPSFEEGKPSVLSLAQTIDKTLRNAGVKRRVFESFDDDDCLKLDSAELTTHIPPDQ